MYTIVLLLFKTKHVFKQNMDLNKTLHNMECFGIYSEISV